MSKPTVMKIIRVTCVGWKSVDARRMPRHPDPERTDPKLHPRASTLDLLRKRVDQRVHVFMTPLVTWQMAAARNVSAVGGAVGKVLAGHRVGIEIVVEVNAVHVVAEDDVHNGVQGSSLHLLRPGIHPQVAAVGVGVLGQLVGDVVARQAGTTGGTWARPGEMWHFRAQKLCERGGGRPGLPPSLIVPMVPMDVKQHWLSRRCEHYSHLSGAQLQVIVAWY